MAQQRTRGARTPKRRIQKKPRTTVKTPLPKSHHARPNTPSTSQRACSGSGRELVKCQAIRLQDEVRRLLGTLARHSDADAINEFVRILTDAMLTTPS